MNIVYNTYTFTRNGANWRFLYDLNKQYDRTNETIRIDNLIKQLEENTAKESLGGTYTIEIAHDSNVVVGFLTHGYDTCNNRYFIEFTVVNNEYRNKGIGTELLYNAFINISRNGYKECELEVLPGYDCHHFWQAKKAIHTGKRRSDMFYDIIADIYTFPDVNIYLENIGKKVELYFAMAYMLDMKIDEQGKVDTSKLEDLYNFIRKHQLDFSGFHLNKLTEKQK